MNRRKHLGRLGRSDEGASLLLALIFIFLVGIVISALLPYAQTGIKEAAVARDVRSTQNAADGAVAGAIERLRHDVTLGTGPGCPTYTAPAYPDPLKAGQFVNVTVTCQAAPGVPPFASDVPPYAIMTTGGSIRADGNNTLSIDGGMYASGPIDTAGGSQTKYAVVGRVFTTTGACSMVSSSVGVVDCPASASDPAFPPIDYPSALGADLGTVQTALANLPKDPPGTCPGGENDYVLFQPGYYSQIPTPDASCGAKPPTVYWFAPCAGASPTTSCTNTAPGVFYLDFPDSTYTNYSDSAYWNLETNKITLIGGSLKSTWLSKPELPGHRCAQNKVGSQIVLGGPTQLVTGNNSEIELCASATSATSKQRIALYGVSSLDKYGVGSSGGARAPTSSGLVAPLTWSNTGGGDSNWTNQDGARKASDFRADRVTPNIATVTVNGNKTWGVDLSDYGTATGTPIVPDGSLITGATVRVTHAEVATTGNIKSQIEVRFADGSVDTCPLSVLTTLGVTTVDLMSNKCDHNYLVSPDFRWKLLHDPTANKFVTITYETVGSKQGPNNASGTATVDGVELQVGYVAPDWDAERCQKGDGGICFAYSNTFSSSTANTFFIGSVYTPDSPLNVTVHNNPETIFQRGVIVNSLQVTANASSKQTDSPFQLPHSDSLDRTVLFTATLTGDSKVLLQARVHYIDCNPAPSCSTSPNAEGNQLYPGREVDIIDWNTFH